MKENQRYPYTHACDFIRALGPVGKGGVVLSRCDATMIRSGMADAMGMDDKIVAEMLADAQLAKTDEDYDKESNILMNALFGGTT